jgi:hypothetical protein
MKVICCAKKKQTERHEIQEARHPFFHIKAVKTSKPQKSETAEKDCGDAAFRRNIIDFLFAL